jgi:hypothetical protein
MKINSRTAQLFIGLIVMCGLGTLAHAAIQPDLTRPAQAGVLLLMALFTARMKAELPGLNGNMSVNLPFILVAVTQLSTLEALAVALPSIAVQCFPKGGGSPKVVQMVFNMSATAVAVGLGSWVTRAISTPDDTWASASLLLLLTGTSVLLAQTVPVAIVISLTDGGKMAGIWSNIFLLSFPYYLLSVGVTSLIDAVSRNAGWQVPLLALPVMYGVYRSYNLYFGRLMGGAGRVTAGKHSAPGALASLEQA